MRPDLKQEIIKTLHTHFPDIITRGEKTEQNSNVEMFFVKELSMDYLPELGEFERVLYQFVIEYYPEDKSERQRKQLREMEFKLIQIFKLWEDMSLRAYSINSEFEADRLNFFIDFNVRYQILISQDEKFSDLEVSI